MNFKSETFKPLASVKTARPGVWLMLTEIPDKFSRNGAQVRQILQNDVNPVEASVLAYTHPIWTSII